ncbi:MAG: O-antigen ligase family protein, partial [Endomicrobia bacterium]|nr:O-antigen ligase family protein [Endomicrobiia bacterium]
MESAQPSYSSFLQKTLTKILLYGLPVLYFLVAVAFYLKTYDSAQIKITIVHLGGLFFVMLWLLSKIEEGNLDFFKKNFIFILPLLLYLFSGIVSFSMSPFKYVSLNEVAKRFIYCGLALIIIDKFNDEKKIMSLFNWLVAAAYIVCIYGIVQIIDYRFFPPPPDAGLDPFLWRQAFGNRIFSTFGNPNFFGDFLVVMSPVTLSLYIYRRKFYLLFLWAMIAVCLFATMSKGAWLGFAAGIFVFAVMYAVTFLRDKINAKTAIAIALVVVVFVAGAGLGIGILTKKRTDSASFRIFTWMSAWEMINTNPVIGTGIGSFYVTYPSWRRPQIFFIEHGHNTESDHPENEYLEVWFDEGIIGLTIFLLLIAFVFTAGYKNILYAH